MPAKKTTILVVDGDVQLLKIVTHNLQAESYQVLAVHDGAETIRWIEWGMRSYHNFALGLALLLFAVAVVRTAWVARPIAYLIGLSGLAYLVQGWVVGSEGFSQTLNIAIVVTWVLSLAWMIWLVVVAWRGQEVGVPSPAH